MPNIYKMSNAGGFTGLTRYQDMLAGNAVWNPWSPEGAFDALASVTLSSTASSVTFTGIPSTYKHLQVRFIGRDNWSNPATYMYFNINGDTGANYTEHDLYGNGSSASAYAAANTSGNSTDIARLSGNSATAGIMGVGITDILDYSNTTKYKTLKTLSGYDSNGSGEVWMISNLWRSTAAITSLSFSVQSGTWAANTSFALYGVK